MPRVADSEIAMVQRHVAQGDAIVKRQVDLVERLYAQGLDATRAEALLAEFQRAQEQHRAHLARISNSN